MSVVVSVTVSVAVLLALNVVDLWLGRIVTRALFRLVDRLPPYRPGGRYHSRSEPKKVCIAAQETERPLTHPAPPIADNPSCRAK